MTSRRKFIKKCGATLLASGASAAFPTALFGKSQKKLGVALVGLGAYSTEQLAPALQMTRNCELRGIVTGSPEKIPKWQKKYGIKDGNVYNYENMHTVADNPDIDVIYIVLPTSMHAEYSIIAANAGKHVWCEKPMAMTAEECQSVIDACNKNKVKLSIGYRLQHEPDNQTIMEYGESNKYGKIQKVEAEAGFYFKRKNVWRLKDHMGGGVMRDMGVYPLNASRYATGEEPIAVTASHEIERKELFSDVDEVTKFHLEFPSGAVADCKATYADNVNRLRIEAFDGWYKLEPFQKYSGVKGETSDGETINQKINDQQAKQMDEDAMAIMTDSPVLVPGEEGQRDIRIVEAVYKAAKTGQRITL